MSNPRDLLDVEILPLLDIWPTNDLNDEVLAFLRQMQPPLPDFPHTPPQVVEVPGPDGAPAVELRIFTPKGAEGKRPVIYHMHGGGYIAGTAKMMDPINSVKADEFGAVVVSVNYRLAPENPFPAPIEDCYAGLRWVAENAEQLGIDADHIILQGESAGGGLAAALAILARDRRGPKLAAQFLIYPMLDHRTGNLEDQSPNPVAGDFIWTRQNNRFGWAAMRGQGPIPADRIGHFSPSMAEDLSGLPPCFLATASLDLFIDENLAYALRLIRAGVPTEVHSYAGAIHSFDMVTDAAVAQCFAADLGNALRRAMR